MKKRQTTRRQLAQKSNWTEFLDECRFMQYVKSDLLKKLIRHSIPYHSRGNKVFAYQALITYMPNDNVTCEHFFIAQSFIVIAHIGVPQVDVFIWWHLPVF